MGFKKLRNGVVYLSKKAEKLVSFKIIFILFLIAICWQFGVVKKELKAVKKDVAQAKIWAIAGSYSSSSKDDLEDEVSSLEIEVSSLKRKVSSLEDDSEVSSLKRKVSSLEDEVSSLEDKVSMLEMDFHILRHKE
jgi:predicted  nucleic acid-binding Zn-ribbon protein